MMDLWFSESHTADVKHSLRVNRHLYSCKSEYQQMGIESNRIESAEIVHDEIHFHIHIVSHGLILIQIGIPAAREATFHRNAAANEAVSFQLTVDAIINVGCSGAPRLKQEVARYLAVNAGHHMANDIWSVHIAILFSLSSAVKNLNRDIKFRSRPSNQGSRRTPRYSCNPA